MTAPDPSPQRPHSPGQSYGIPESASGLLPWSHVDVRMAAAMVYWVCTVDEAGRPHATPVDGLWLDNTLFFGGEPDTRRQRNIAANPAVCVHLPDGQDVVILHGEVVSYLAPDRVQAERLSEEALAKYGYTPGADAYLDREMSAFRPRVAFAWSAFPNDVTRWELDASP